MVEAWNSTAANFMIAIQQLHIYKSSKWGPSKILSTAVAPTMYSPNSTNFRHHYHLTWTSNSPEFNPRRSITRLRLCCENREFLFWAFDQWKSEFPRDPMKKIKKTGLPFFQHLLFESFKPNLLRFILTKDKNAITYCYSYSCQICRCC